MGAGGNIKLLQRTQQKQFSTWLQANGYDNFDLSTGAPIEAQGQDDEEDDEDGEEDDEDDEDADDADDADDPDDPDDVDDADDADDDEAAIAAASESTQDYIDAESTTTRTDNTRNDANRQTKVPSTLEAVLLMIQTVDESGLEKGPKHANDTHDIVKENGKLLQGEYGFKRKGCRE